MKKIKEHYVNIILKEFEDELSLLFDADINNCENVNILANLDNSLDLAAEIALTFSGYEFGSNHFAKNDDLHCVEIRDSIISIYPYKERQPDNAFVYLHHKNANGMILDNLFNSGNKVCVFNYNGDEFTHGDVSSLD